MGLKEIIEEFDNTVEPRLEEIREFFKNKDNKHVKFNAATIQREFSMGYRTATRAFNQLKKKKKL